MRIIRANQEHLDELAGLFDQYRVFYQEVADRKACRDFLAARLMHEQSVVFAAQSDQGCLVGFTQLYCSFCSVELKPLVYLYDLFVDPAARRTGVARALMERARTFALEQGAGRVTLQTALDNVRAQALYEDLGYVRDTEFYCYNLQLEG